MDLTLLKYIVTIAEEEKISPASKKLHVTSSALSQAVKKLENDLGIPVFEKLNSHTFKLTEAGRIYVEAARNILSIKDAAYREIEDVQHDNRGSFIFGCSPKRGLAMLANVFPTFHKAYPHIKIELKEANLNTLYDSVIDGSVDIAVLTPLSEEHKFVNLEPLDKEEIVLAIPVNHHLAGLAGKDRRGTIAISDLKLFQDENWMMTNKDSMLRNLTDSLFEKAGFFPRKILLETSSTSPHLAAVEEGIAVSLVPKPRKNSKARIITLHLEPRLHRRLYAAYRKGYLLSRSQRFFIDLMGNFYTTPGEGELPPHRTGW